MVTREIGAAAAVAAPLVKRNDPLMKVSQDFEALFLNQLIGAMRSTVSREDSLIPQSTGERAYQAMLDTEYSKQMAASEQIGLSKMVYEHLLRVSSGQ